jgi:hypothetical protein
MVFQMIVWIVWYAVKRYCPLELLPHPSMLYTVELNQEEEKLTPSFLRSKMQSDCGETLCLIHFVNFNVDA